MANGASAPKDLRSLFLLLLCLLAAPSLLTPALAGVVPFSKVFLPDTIGPGSTTRLEFTIENFFANPLDDLAFTDVLPAGITIATPSGAINNCDGVLNAPDGGGVISLNGGKLGVGASCTISVNVTSSAIGSHMNTTGTLSSSEGDLGSATDTLNVVADRPGFIKSFSPAAIPPGGVSVLTLTIDNTANASTADQLFFTDNLPPGMVVATPPNAATDCVGFFPPTLTADPGSNTISLVFGSVNALSSCTVTVDVTTGEAGLFGNVTGELTGAGALSSGFATANLNVPINFLVKLFTDDPAPPGGTVNLRFTITNPSRSDSATNIEFMDDLDDALLGLAATNTPLSDPCGAGSSLTGTTLLTFSGGSLPPEGSCTFSVMLSVPLAAIPGNYTNTTTVVTAVIGGMAVEANMATDILRVRSVPLLTKEFTDDPAPAGSSVTLEFTIVNTSPTSSATNIAFTDNLTAVLDGLEATGLPADGFCGPGSQIVQDVQEENRVLSMTGGNLIAGGFCTFQVTLSVPQGTPNGVYPNVTREISAIVDGQTVQGSPGVDDLTVIAAPRLRKEFPDDTALAGETVTLQFTLTHDVDAPGAALGISFSDDLDAALTGLTAVGLPMNDVCGSGSSISGTTNLTFIGGSLSPGESCTFSVTLQVPDPAPVGGHTNTTSVVNAMVQGTAVTGPAASDVLTIPALLFTKEFTDDPAEPLGTATLQFTINNVGLDDATSIVFTDNLDDVVSGLTAVGLPMNEICGAGSSLQGLAGDTLLLFSGGSVNAGQMCTFSVTLQLPMVAADSQFFNLTSNLNATVGGSSVVIDPATDLLTVGTADLVLSKTDSVDPVAAGDILTYTLTVVNNGPGDAQDVVVNDVLPAEVTLLSTSGCAEDPAGVPDCTLGTIVANGSAQYTITVGVDPSFIGTLTNDASVSSAASDEGVGVDSVSETTQVFAAADLVLDKADSVDPAVAGTPLTYTLTVTNNGPSDATNVTVNDALPAGVALVSTSGCAEDPIGVPNCSLGTVLAGESIQYTIAVNVDASATGILANNATVSSSAMEANPGDESAAETTAVVSVADLTLAKVDSLDPVTAGNNLTYTLTVNNNGPSDAQNVVVADTLPAGVTLVSTSGCAEDPAGVPNCTHGTITAGGSAQYTITVNVDSSTTGLLNNGATVSSAALEGNPGDESASELTAVTAVADLVLSKTDSVDPVQAGANLTYTLTVVNNGPSDARDVVVSDVLPAGVTLASTSGCAEPTGVPNCTLGTIAAGGSAQYTINVSVDASTTGTLNNTASVSASTPEASPGDESVLETTQVTPVVDLVLDKIDLADPTVAGTELTYTLTVTNNGPSAAQDVVVTDALPPGVTLVSTSDCAEDPAGVPNCTLGTIPGGGSTQYALTVLVESSFLGPLENSATVSSSTLEIAPGDETAVETTDVIRQADLEVTISDDLDPAPVGENVAYSVTIANNGPSDSTSSTVAINLPQGVQFVSGPPGCPVINNQLSCPAGSLTAGASTTLTVVVEVGPDAPDQLVLTAEATPSDPDPVLANNADQETTAVDSSIDLSLLLRSLPEPSLLGLPLTVRADVTNAGPATATQVQVRLVLPGGFDVESTSVTPVGACSRVQNRLTCGVQDIRPDESAQVEVRLNPLEVGSFRISADVTARNVEINTVDNSGQLVITVGPAADLRLDKIAPFDAAPAGGRLDYTLTLLNNGPSPSGDVTVTDTLPEGTTFVISEPPDICEPMEGGEGEPNQVVCSPSSLDPNETVVIELTVELDPDLRGPFVNRATVTPVVFDPNPDNNEAEAAAQAVARGDLNRDGVVDVEDIGLLIREINDGDGEDVADAGGGSTAGDVLFDVNGDGVINRLDLQALARIILRREE